MSASDAPHAWTIARHRMRIDVPGAAVLWLLFAAGVAALVAGVAIFGTIAISGWEQASGVPRWYMGITGVYLTWSSLPLYVAHGHTRREFAVQAPVAIAATTTVVALLMTMGYAIETAVYRAAGWPQTLTREHLFDTPDQLLLVFTEFWLVFAVWCLAGALLGAGFYRNQGSLGLLMLPVALLMVGIIEYTVGDGIGSMPFGFVQAVLQPLATLDPGSVATAVAIWSGVMVTGGTLTWAVIRDMPLRNKPA